jgi:hypothetical protein
LIWERIKNNYVTKEKPKSFYEVGKQEYLEKWLRAVDNEWITKTSNITSTGYAVYVISCLCLNKTSLFGGPLVSSKTAHCAVDLEYYDMIEYNMFKHKYVLGVAAPAMLTIIVKCIRGQGDPEI